MKKVLLFMLLVGAVTGATAQETEIFLNGMTHGAAKTMNPLSSTLIKTKAPDKYETRGSEFLYPEWRRGVLSLKKIKSPYSHNSIKLDLAHDVLEFDMGKEGFKVLGGHELDTLLLDNPQGGTQTFIRAEGMHLPGHARGFCEILYQGGEVAIVKTYYSKVIPANYNATLNMGKRYDDIVIRSDLFLIDGEHAYELTGKKKETLSLLSNYFVDVEKAYKQYKPNFKDEMSLVSFISLNLVAVKK